MTGEARRTFRLRRTYAVRTQDGVSRRDIRKKLVFHFQQSLFLGLSKSCRSFSQFPPFPQTLGLSESRRQSQSTAETPSNVSDWRVGCEVQSELPGPPLRVTARQEQVGSAALSGHPFSLKYLVYASCFSTSAGALGRMPWGIQGLFQDALSKVFSFQKEARSWSRWS